MFRFPCLAFHLALAPLALLAADGDRIVVHMQIKRGIDAWSGQVVDFGMTKDDRVIAAEGSPRTGKAPRATIVAEPIAGQAAAYRLTIRPAGGDPVTATVTASQPARVEIARGVTGTLPYVISLNPNAGPAGSPREMLLWAASYRAEGTLTVGSCKVPLAVWDMSSDGEFTRRDFNGGDAVGLDLNGDGQFLGREEHVTAGEIFQACGKSFYVDPDSMEPDGTAVTVVETSAPRPRMNAPIPSFSVTTTDGALLRSETWKGKVTVLDFWASWCGYCIAGFPKLKEMRQAFAPGLEVVGINTDEPSAFAAARKVLAKSELPWPEVMSGKGLGDPVWGMFHAVESKSLPLYVVVDRDGVMRYEGSGGEDLAELRAAIEKCSAPR